MQPRSAVAAAAAADAAEADGTGLAKTAAATAPRASLTAGPLLPGHCLERPAALAKAERDLQGTLNAAVAAATFTQSLGVAAAENQAVGQHPQAATLRLLAPTVEVSTEWLPASETTNAAWLLARAANDSSEPDVDSGKRGSEDKALQVAEQRKTQLEGEVGCAALEHAARALAVCHEDSTGGATWQVAALRRYMVAAAMVRRTAIVAAVMGRMSLHSGFKAAHELLATCEALGECSAPVLCCVVQASSQSFIDVRPSATHICRAGTLQSSAAAPYIVLI